MAAEVYNKPIKELLDPYLRPLAKIYHAQMQGHVARMTVADGPKA